MDDDTFVIPNSKHFEGYPDEETTDNVAYIEGYFLGMRHRKLTLNGAECDTCNIAVLTKAWDCIELHTCNLNDSFAQHVKIGAWITAVHHLNGKVELRHYPHLSISVEDLLVIICQHLSEMTANELGKLLDTACLNPHATDCENHP